MSIPRLQAYQGPALWSYGFRPFFLFGAVYAGAVIPLWLAIYEGILSMPLGFAPRDWHAHEMLFGFVAAVVGGFLLTAIPNWTGRLPLNGRPLQVLFASWVLGRTAMLLSATIGWIPTAACDALFLVLLALAAAREIVAGRKFNNLKIVAIISLFAASNIAFHIEAHVKGNADISARFALALVVVLIGLVGGRIVPSFTRNWLARQGIGRLPVPFNRYDAVTMIVSALALLAFAVRPTGIAAATMLGIAGVLQAVRLARWAGDRTWPDRLVFILHVAYAFIPAGFVLGSLAALDILSYGAAIHAWTGGAIGAMTLAVMSRATLGHTGRELKASLPAQIVYAAVVLAALARICAAIEPDYARVLMLIAGLGWSIAFFGFAGVFGGYLLSPRR